MNYAWNEMVIITLCLVLYYIFSPWFIVQCIWDISTPISHKPYKFIQILLIPILLKIIIL